MTLTSEVEAKGLKAYEQARAFERLRAWRLPLGYGLLVVFLVLLGLVAMGLKNTVAGLLMFGAALLFAISAWFHWRDLKRRYAVNMTLLAELEAVYGDQLPWVQVRKHFAELEKLQRELAEEKMRRSAE